MSKMLEIIDKNIDSNNLCVSLKLYETDFKALSKLVQNGSQSLSDIKTGDLIKEGVFQDIYNKQKALIKRFQTYIDKIKLYIKNHNIDISLELVKLDDISALIKAGKKLNVKLLEAVVSNEKKLVENRENILDTLYSITKKDKIDYKLNNYKVMLILTEDSQYSYPYSFGGSSVITDSVFENLEVGKHNITIMRIKSLIEMDTSEHLIEVKKISGIKYYYYTPPETVKNRIDNKYTTRNATSSDYLDLRFLTSHITRSNLTLDILKKILP